MIRHVAKWLITFLICLVFLAVPHPRGNCAQNVHQLEWQEYTAKAGFLYKFLFFIDWPDPAFDSSHKVLVIGIIGDDQFKGAFKPVEGEVINGRKLVIRKFKKGTSGESLWQCHILFISESLKDHIKEIIKSLDNHPVLTVSEVDGFIHNGGMINFISERNDVKVEINRGAAERVGIKIRSKLLRLAKKVYKK